MMKEEDKYRDDRTEPTKSQKKMKDLVQVLQPRPQDSGHTCCPPGNQARPPLPLRTVGQLLKPRQEESSGQL